VCPQLYIKRNRVLARTNTEILTTLSFPTVTTNDNLHYVIKSRHNYQKVSLNPNIYSLKLVLIMTYCIYESMVEVLYVT